MSSIAVRAHVARSGRAEPNRSLTLAVLATAALIVWTVVTIVVPPFRFDFSAPGLRGPVEAIGALISAMTALLAYLRFSLTGSRSALCIAVAFVLIAANRVMIGVVGPSGSATGEQILYFWTATRVLAGAFFLAAAARWAGVAKQPPRHALRVMVAASTAALGALGVVLLGIWSIRADLPPLALLRSAGPPLFLTPTPADVLLGMTAASIYFAASFLHLRRAHETDSFPALPAALIVAAFSQIHYMLDPVIVAERLNTGDVLRVLFSAVLFVGVIREVRRMYTRERDGAAALASAYAAERSRVRDLERAEREHAELAQIASHDMGHAVAAVRTYAVALERRWGHLDDDTRLDVVRSIGEQSVRLRELADRAATTGWLRAGDVSLTTRPIAVADLVRDIEEEIRGVVESVRIEMEEACRTLVVRADPIRILQVFTSLLDARKNDSREEPSPDLTVRALDGEVLFSIRGAQTEFHEVELARLFKPLPGTDAAPFAGSRGASLGLYIARRIVEAHGGRMWAESNPAGGSPVQFTLPLPATNSHSS